MKQARSFRVLPALAVFLIGQLLSAQTPPSPPGPDFTEEITVALSTVTVRVVDALGNPVTGLGPEDFRVRVGRREIPVAGVDWFSSGETERPRPAPLGGTAEPAPVEAPQPSGQPAGQLVLFFVQADLNPTRISGQLRLRPYTRELLDRLHPDDRAAVVSYDSHLKLWQDFTRDRDAVYAALDRAMVWSPEGEPEAAAGEISLAAGFDREAARRAASPEKALEVTARALAALPGEKSIVYLGWGLGRYTSWGVQMTPDYAPALKALTAAHVSVFVLDVTSADFHSLEVGLQGVAAATGGTYAKTNVLPGLATDSLVRTLTGFYVLTLDQGEIAGAEGAVRIDLRRKKGTVLARPISVRDKLSLEGHGTNYRRSKKNRLPRPAPFHP
jgi:VWFA-related protein